MGSHSIDRRNRNCTLNELGAAHGRYLPQGVCTYERAREDRLGYAKSYLPLTTILLYLTMPYARSIALVFLMASLSACAGSRETATETAPPHPLVGSWDYELDSPQGLITGVLVVNDTDGVLTGSVTNTSSPILSSEIAELLFDPETFAVNFTFSTEEYLSLIHI